MQFKRSLLLVALLTAVVFITGCVSESSTKETTSSTSKALLEQTSSANAPANINMFSAVSEGEILRLFFLLEDANGQNTVGNGEVAVQIKDSRGKDVFTQRFNVKTSDFTDYQFQLTGNGIGKAYEWRVNQKDIQKGVSTGTANITFTTTDGKTLKATATYVQIPEYTVDEIKQLYENQYNKNAKTIGTVKTKGNFEITLVKYGFYTHLKYDTWGDEVTDFRVDMKIKNIGSEQDSFITYDDAILQGSNQYKSSFNNKLDTSDMRPGVIKEGYLLFEEVPKTLTGQIQIIAGKSYNAAFHELTTEFDVVL
ncbi:Uncharacterised protein [uncultured archaeon]|nr:Uncharacterised protein [uncultured archaeon]